MPFPGSTWGATSIARCTRFSACRRTTVNPRKILFSISDALDGLAFTACGLFAASLLIAGPLVLTYRFLSEQRYLAASISVGAWLLFAAAGMRDLWRRRFSWVSGSLFVIWLAVTLVIWSRIEGG